MDNCRACARPLTHDEIALTQKLVSRGARTFYCLSCLAKRFDVDEATLREKIVQFKEMGCTLFEEA